MTIDFLFLVGIIVIWFTVKWLSRGLIVLALIKLIKSSKESYEKEIERKKEEWREKAYARDGK